jgi:LPS-assembly lipoprotein
MKYFLPLLTLLLLTACGFQPIYGKNKHSPSGPEDKLALVEISNIPNREGQYLRNALIDRFYRHARPAGGDYLLTVRPLRENLIDLDITKSSDATRGQLRLETDITLADAQSGKILLQRRLHTITSYNILGSEFATRVSEENARSNALDDLARQIELQLSLYFKR